MGIFQKIGRSRKPVEYSHKAVDPMFKMFNPGALLNKTATCQSAEMGNFGLRGGECGKECNQCNYSRCILTDNVKNHIRRQHTECRKCFVSVIILLSAFLEMQ